MSRFRWLVLVVIAAAIAAFFVFDLAQYFSLDVLKAKQAALHNDYLAHPLETAALFFAAYVAVAGLSLPGAAIMTLAAGAIFGLFWGTVLVSFASSLGATLAFLASRFLLRDTVQRGFADRLATVNAGIAKDGAFYLFTLRLVPAFPFFVINLVTGLTLLPAWTFYWVSQAGMLLGTLVYVNAGTEIARIESLSGILSPGLVASFTLLGVFPLLVRWLLARWHARRVYARWSKPRRFDSNVVVIGGGSAGLVSAYIAAAVQAKVILVEQSRMGGDCLNTGCVPSKALIRSARFLAHARRAPEFGMRDATVQFDFAEVMERVQSIVGKIAPHDSAERYRGLGVECLRGTATIATPWTVDVRMEDGAIRRLTTRNIIIAAGARPLIPPIPGLLECGPLTSENIWALRTLPPRLIVLGGGPIGCELAQCFARFGSRVMQVEMLPRLLMREDPEISDMLMARFAEEGIAVLVGHRAKQVIVENGIKRLIVEVDGTEHALEFDEILCSVGRVANTSGYGLAELGIPLTTTRTIETNEYQQTSYPNIYACGDVAGPYQFTHTAAHQAWYAAVNALFRRFRMFKTDYSVIPWATFTEPEIARVGMNETEARQRDVAHEVTSYDISELDRAIVDGEAHGRVKVLTAAGTDKILGATIVGDHAGELITEFVTAMRHRLGLNQILGTIHIYPTLAEANKYAAGAWKRARVTRGQTRFLEAFHGWLRGSGTLAGVLRTVPALLRNRRPAHGTPSGKLHGEPEPQPAHDAARDAP